MHLLLPLLGSLLFVSSLILVKRTSAPMAGEKSIGPLTTLFFANEVTAIAFTFVWLLGGTIPSWTLLWQPAVIAVLFVAGLAFTFAAIEAGDVSIATPIFGVKVVFVAVLLTVLGKQDLPIAVWYAAVMASLGIALIQWTGRSHHKRVMLTVGLAISAATTYATFDVLVQSWAPAWGPGRFLPIVFWMVALISLGLIPWVQWDRVASTRIYPFLIPASILMGLQAICIVVTLSIWGDAARVNVVYSLRAMWSVLLAWLVARKWGGAEAHVTTPVMVMRLAGAGLLTIAVVLTILA